MPLGTELGLRLRDIVLDGDPTHPPVKGHSPPFSANVRCGQTAEWIKMPLGMVVGLGPGAFVFDGDPAPPERKGTPTPTQFLAHVYIGQTAGWMKTPLCTAVDLGPHCVRRGASCQRKVHSNPPVFSAHVYCGYGRPSHLLLSSCRILLCHLPKFTGITGDIIL